MIDDRKKTRARQSSYQLAINRLRDDHGEKGRRKQPGQISHAAGNAHLVAQRPQYVISGKKREEIGEGPQRRCALLPCRCHGSIEYAPYPGDSLCFCSAPPTAWPKPGPAPSERCA